MPLSVHQALTSFESNKSAVVNLEVGRLREATQLLNRYQTLSSILISRNTYRVRSTLIPQSVHFCQGWHMILATSNVLEVDFPVRVPSNVYNEVHNNSWKVVCRQFVYVIFFIEPYNHLPLIITAPRMQLFQNNRNRHNSKVSECQLLATL